MVDAVKWLVVGLGAGVVAEWARHGSVLRGLATLPKFQTDSERLEREVVALQSELASLREQAGLVAGLRAQIMELESRPSDVVGAIASEDRPVAAMTVAGLEAISSLAPEFRAKLEAVGVLTPAELASRSEEQLLELVDAQPWDEVDVSAWITEALAIEEAANGAVTEPVPAGTAGDDLSNLPEITGDQVNALAAAGIKSFSDIASISEDDLLAAIEAQPWDVIDVASWIEFAKGQS